MKPFKSVNEQIEILIGRGLIISNREESEKYLIHNNYYNVVNMYGKLFQKNENKYITGTSFEEIKALHIFDNELKNLLMKYILSAEKHFKSIFAYYFSEKYHKKEFSYLDTSNYKYKEPLDLIRTLNLVSKTIKDQNKSYKENAVKHHYRNHKDVPIWVIVNELTFGNIINLYKFTDNKTKNNIAKELSKILYSNIEKHVQLEPHELEIILINMLSVRNCVAHDNKLLYFKCAKHIRYLPELYKPIEITAESPKQSPFHIFIALKCFLLKDEYSILHNSLLKRMKNLEKKLDKERMDDILSAYGFPHGWHNIVKRIKQK